MPHSQEMDQTYTTAPRPTAADFSENAFQKIYKFVVDDKLHIDIIVLYLVVQQSHCHTSFNDQL